VGLEKFAADSIEEYIQIAVDVASDLENLQSIRQKLRQTSLDSGLYDGSKMALDLETAFESMWQQFLHNNDNTDT
jgi:predicted O-linked N-acetylglucosamine transferase (SPINDLY family)